MTLQEALEITGHLNTASKMPCFTYSISAKRCKRGGMLHKLKITTTGKQTVCGKCYARRGNFARPTIQLGLEKKFHAMQHPLWVEAMVIVITAYEFSGYFRWFSSGDVQDLEMLYKIVEVCRRLPFIKFWLPTHEIGIIAAFRRKGGIFPSNLVVRVSSDYIDEEPSHNMLKKLGVLGGAVNRTKFDCPAYKQDGMCQQCRRCWDENLFMITYPYH